MDSIRRIADNAKLIQADQVSDHAVDHEQTQSAPPAEIQTTDDQVQPFDERATLFHELVHAQHHENYPAKISAPDLQASANDISIEGLTIQGDSLTTDLSRSAQPLLESDHKELFSNILREIATPPDNTLKNLQDQLHELAAQKKVLLGELTQLRNQISALELGVAQSPSSQGSAQLIALNKQMEELKNQLSQIDVEIKQILNQIENIEAKEEQEQDRAKQSEEQDQGIMNNLSKAADSYSEILKNIKLD